MTDNLGAMELVQLSARDPGWFDTSFIPCLHSEACSFLQEAGDLESRARNLRVRAEQLLIVYEYAGETALGRPLEYYRRREDAEHPAALAVRGKSVRPQE